MTPAEILAQMQGRCDAATRGCWGWAYDNYGYINPTFNGLRLSGDENGNFIARARTDLPMTIAALQAVLELHRPVHAVFSWSTGPRDDEPCPECWGKAGVHECGCWADSDIEYSCASCRGERGARVAHPCQTVRAITRALGEATE